MKIINAMSVDVEDYFHVHAFSSIVQPDQWDNFSSRVQKSTERLLDLYSQASVKATFFTLGWVAQRNASLVQRIVSEGHELASHGYDHQLVTSLSRQEFHSDVERAKHLLEDISGSRVKGYRAPTFSITAQTPWAHDVLAQTGHLYSSSTFPIAHDFYGDPYGKITPHRVAGGALLEIPMSITRLLGANRPVSGGGWFRLMPYALFKAGLRRVNAEGRRGVFYIHPWEVDSDQPRMDGLKASSRFRHYVNLSRTASRIARLAQDFQWDRMDRVFSDDLANLQAVI